MSSKRTPLLVAFLAVLVLVAAACGGDDSGTIGSPDPTPGDSTEGEVTPDETPTDTPTQTSSEGGGSGIVTIDGVSMNFSMDDVVHSQIEGLDDLTFEVCDPSFFGAGFRVIGYAVDPGGELILDDNGAIAGTLILTFPLTPADEGTTGPPELELSYESAGFDLDMVPIGQENDVLPGSESTWTVGTTTIGGSVVLANSRSEGVLADFEVSCG